MPDNVYRDVCGRTDDDYWELVKDIPWSPDNHVYVWPGASLYRSGDTYYFKCHCGDKGRLQPTPRETFNDLCAHERSNHG